jgi:hypothetical protein
MRTRRGNGYLPVLVVLVIVMLAIGIYFAAGAFQQKQSPARLTVATPIVNPVAGQAFNLPFTILNQGGQANQVILTLTSSIFSPSTISNLPTTVSAGSQVPITIEPVFQDVPYGSYSISTTISYQDSNGTHSYAGPTFSLYVVPNVQITNVGWPAAGLFNLGTKNSIGPNDNTRVYFNVQSGSSTVVYGGLSAVAVVNPQVSELTVSPTSIAIESIGPNGKTIQYSFMIQSVAAPPGKYNISIEILAGGNVATSLTVQLTVTSS